jgi:hypothetical protein
MKKSILVVAVLAAFVFIAMSFTPPPPDIRYKNLKVLSKKTTKAQLDSVMKAFTMALGVKCGACHVRGNDAQRNWNFASDSNQHKNIARGMMRMTARINKKYFREEQKEKNLNLVGCYTCHNGKEHPAPKAPPQPGGPGGQQGPPPGGINGGQRPPGGNPPPVTTPPTQTPPTQTPPPNQQ